MLVQSKQGINFIFLIEEKLNPIVLLEISCRLMAIDQSIWGIYNAQN
jgi:hypothetical protein